MKIEERVIRSFDAASNERFSEALALICPAIEESARKLFGVKSAKRSDYKNFIRSYIWFIERFSHAGINLEETKFPGKIETDRAPIEQPDFADIIYHAFRCSLAHGENINEKFQLIDPNTEEGSHWKIDIRSGSVRMPHHIVWALIATVAICVINKDIKTCTSIYFYWPPDTFIRPDGTPYRLELDLMWGSEEVVKSFFSKYDPIRVTLKL